MEELKFYDMRKKESFFSDNYKFKERSINNKPRHFAVAVNDGTECWRVVSNNFYEENN